MTDDTTLNQLSLFDVEVWRPVVGFEDTYAVSNYGRVMRTSRSLGTKVGKILKLKTDKVGYSRVVLYKHKRQHAILIHRVVALAFIGTPTASTVNHIDGDKSNNRVSNLEYATQSENNTHAFRIGLHVGLKKEDNPQAKLTQIQVDEIRELSKRGAKTPQLARQFSVSYMTIYRVIKYMLWK